MIKEFCSENFKHVPEAIEAGIHRIELCDDLDVGGTTPSRDVQHEVVEYAHSKNVEVVTMIRPRGGDFIYSDSEKETMRAEARYAVSCGANGIVFGALTSDNKIDWTFVDELMAIAKTRQTVFHMAFDTLSETDQLDAIRQFNERKLTRLLTRGAETGSAIENAEWINKLIIEAANGQLEILAGGGITFENLPEASNLIKTNQFHGTKIVKLT